MRPSVSESSLNIEEIAALVGGHPVLSQIVSRLLHLESEVDFCKEKIKFLETKHEKIDGHVSQLQELLEKLLEHLEKLNHFDNALTTPEI